MSDAATDTMNDATVTLTLQRLIDAQYSVAPKTSLTPQELSHLPGHIASRKRGQGLEFEDLRCYTPGDDVRHIDWKVSARHNQLYTRLYREEREQVLTLAVDFSDRMFTGSDALKAVKAGYVAATLAWQCVSTGGRCGLLIQTGNGFHATRAATGDKAALAICAALANQFESAKSDWYTQLNHVSSEQSVFTPLINTGRELGSIVAISGLDTVNNELAMTLKELEAAKRIAVIYIDDPLEHKPLPTGTYHYKTANGQRRVVLNQTQTRALREKLADQHRQLINLFTDVKIPLLHSSIGAAAIKHSLIQLGFLA